MEITPTTTAENLIPTGSPALPALAYLSTLSSKESVRGMTSSLNAIAAVLTGVADYRLNAAIIAAAVASLEGAPATKNKALAAMKGLARSAYRLDWISGECYTKIKDINGYRGSRQVTGRQLEMEEIGALLSACREDHSPAGLRDTALFSIACITGARRAELVSLELGNLSETDESLAEITVIGKGQKQRSLYLHGKAVKALDAWLDLRGRSPGKLFTRITQTGELSTEGMSTAALAKILKKRLGQANLTNVRMHDLRRSVCGNLLDAGHSLSTVADILGHSSPQVTARYDLRGKRAAVAASRTLSLP